MGSHTSFVYRKSDVLFTDLGGEGFSRVGTLVQDLWLEFKVLSLGRATPGVNVPGVETPPSGGGIDKDETAQERDKREHPED